MHVSSKCQYLSCPLMAGVVIVPRGGASISLPERPSPGFQLKRVIGRVLRS